MEKTKSVKTFKESYELKAKSGDINECSWFGIIWGLALFVTGAYQVICTQGILNIIFWVISVLGVVLLVVGVAAPLCLRRLIETVKKVFSIVGSVVLKIILLPVYLVMTIINLFTNKKYSSQFGFRNWEERHSSDSVFGDFDSVVENKHSSMGVVIRVMSFFINNKMYVVVPIVIVLLIVGAVMFFASSSAVFSFVYTLF